MPRHELARADTRRVFLSDGFRSRAARATRSLVEMPSLLLFFRLLVLVAGSRLQSQAFAGSQRAAESRSSLALWHFGSSDDDDRAVGRVPDRGSTRATLFEHMQPSRFSDPPIIGVFQSVSQWHSLPSPAVFCWRGAAVVQRGAARCPRDLSRLQHSTALAHTPETCAMPQVTVTSAHQWPPSPYVCTEEIADASQRFLLLPVRSLRLRENRQRFAHRLHALQTEKQALAF